MQEMQETQVQSRSQEYNLEKEMSTHSSILAWRIPWTEEPGELQSMELQRVGHDWVTEHTIAKCLPKAMPVQIIVYQTPCEALTVLH